VDAHGVHLRLGCADAGLIRQVLPGWHLPLAEGATLQGLTLLHPVASEIARSLLRFVRDALRRGLISERCRHGYLAVMVDCHTYLVAH
jgi:hypothetical protein